MAAKQKNKIIFYVTASMLLALAAGIYFVIKYVREQKALVLAEAATYAAFGIDMPQGYPIRGIDVSSHQGVIFWPSVKAMNINNITIQFAFMKASEGLNDGDKYFAKNWKVTGALGITHGAYHFFLATKDGNKQASNFIKKVDLKKKDFPPVVDVEELYEVPQKVMRQRLKQCLDSLEKHYKTKPILYTYIDFYDNYLGKAFDDYPLWIAHYDEPEKPRIKRKWWFWQHSQEARINGITTFVDCNVFNGDSTNFSNVLIK
jgi:lysozyme